MSEPLLDDIPQEACRLRSCHCCQAAERDYVAARERLKGLSGQLLDASRALADAHALIRDALQANVLSLGLAARARALLDTELPF